MGNSVNYIQRIIFGDETMNFSLGVSKIITPDEVIDNAFISIENDLIKEISTSKPENVVASGNYLLFPALVNSHDHLIGAYYPKAGAGPYLNWLPWDNDLKKAKVYEERGKNSVPDLYYISCYRLLIGGVTTVSDHVPHILTDNFNGIMPIRVIQKFGLAHEASSYDLKWGDGVEIEYQRSVENNWPFITHICEGWDDEARNGVKYLNKVGALSDHTVLIHGIAYADEDIKTLAQNNVNHVWCPISNYYMFNKTSKIKELLSNGVNVGLGTDSPMSGGLNLLEEMRFAKRLYKEIYGEILDDKEIVKMATINGARCFRLQNKLGTIEEGKIADLLLIKDTGNDPYTSLVEAKHSDIMLVVHKGEPIYGDETFESLFKTLKISYKRVNIDKTKKILKTDKFYPDLKEIMNRVKANVGYDKILPFLPVE